MAKYRGSKTGGTTGSNQHGPRGVAKLGRGVKARTSSASLKNLAELGSKGLDSLLEKVGATPLAFDEAAEVHGSASVISAMEAGIHPSSLVFSDRSGLESDALDVSELIRLTGDDRCTYDPFDISEGLCRGGSEVVEKCLDQGVDLVAVTTHLRSSSDPETTAADFCADHDKESLKKWCELGDRINRSDSRKFSLSVSQAGEVGDHNMDPIDYGSARREGVPHEELIAVAPAIAEFTLRRAGTTSDVKVGTFARARRSGATVDSYCWALENDVDTYPLLLESGATQAQIETAAGMGLTSQDDLDRSVAVCMALGETLERDEARAVALLGSRGAGSYVSHRLKGTDHKKALSYARRIKE